MRSWEFDDTRAIPTNLVLEQDFILKIRRIHRMDTPYLVANISVSIIPAEYSGRGTLEDVHRRIQSLTMAQKGVYCEMSNGDVFVIWPATSMARIFPDQVLMVALPNGVGPDDRNKFVKTYSLPEDYALLRERANHYIDESRSAAISDDASSPIRILQSEAARGPLTSWRLSQLEKLFKEIDLSTFIRSQTVYELQRDKSWRELFDETFIGLEDLRQAYFPHTVITEPKHLFLDLCQVLDRSLLSTLTVNYDSISAMMLSLNLSLPTVLGTEFMQFTHRVPRQARARIGFEIQCGDMMQDFGQTLNVLATLRQEGYKIAIDGVTPDMMAYINFARFDVDAIKINVAKDRAGMLKYQAVRQAIQAAPREKIVFFRCDSEQALHDGTDMGITRFQGWLIDDQARKWRKG